MKKSLAYKKPKLRTLNNSEMMCNSGSSATAADSNLNSCVSGPANSGGTCISAGLGASGTSAAQCNNGYEATGTQQFIGDSGCQNGYTVTPTCGVGTNDQGGGVGYCSTGTSADATP